MTVHQCPRSGVTPCCGKTPFELPWTDQMTEDPELVTCVAGVTVSSGDGAGGGGADPGKSADVSPGSLELRGGPSNEPSDMTSRLRPRYEEIIVTLRLRKIGDETWREAALRYGKTYNLEEEVTEAYESYRKEGDSEPSAAFAACYDWDILDYVDDQRDDQGPPSRDNDRPAEGNNHT